MWGGWTLTAIGQCDACDRHAWLPACLYNLLPELRRMPPPCPPAWQLDS